MCAPAALQKPCTIRPSIAFPSDNTCMYSEYERCIGGSTFEKPCLGSWNSTVTPWKKEWLRCTFTACIAGMLPLATKPSSFGLKQSQLRKAFKYAVSKSSRVCAQASFAVSDTEASVFKGSTSNELETCDFKAGFDPVALMHAADAASCMTELELGV